MKMTVSVICWLWIALCDAGAVAQTTNTFPASGSVGIGTTTPGATLDIAMPSGTATANLRLSANAAAAWGLYTITRTDNLTGWGLTSYNEGYGGIQTSWTYNGGANAMFLQAIGSGLGASVLSLYSASPTYGTSGNPMVSLNAGGNTYFGGGNVGIGTLAPGALLEVNGNVKLTTGSGASITFPDGTTQATAWNGVLSGGDYAESVDVSGDRSRYEPGDVIVIDQASPGRFLRSAKPYSTLVTGIYSTNPGVLGRRQRTDKSLMKEEVPMAMTGIVPTKVSAENGPIEIGDFLVSSSNPGYAMKGTDRSQMLGAVIGKALGSIDEGKGVIEVVITLQ
jgi:hypothetical protein